MANHRRRRNRGQEMRPSLLPSKRVTWQDFFLSDYVSGRREEKEKWTLFFVQQGYHSRDKRFFFIILWPIPRVKLDLTFFKKGSLFCN